MPPKGKYFYVKSRLNGLVLDIESCDDNPGAAVITWEQKDDEPDNQLWYMEKSTDTIRSKMNDLCITAGDDGLTMEDYESDNEDQQWVFKINQERIRNVGNRDRVVDIMDCNEDPGARVSCWDDNDGDNQKWECDRVNTRFFMIRSRMNGLVVDIEAQRADEGAKVIMWEETGEDNQLWYEDEDGIIRSKLNDFAMEGDKGDDIVMMPCDGDREQHQWHRVGKFIGMRAHRGHLVLDIKAKNEEPGAELTAWDRTGDDNQLWDYEYS